MLPLENKYFKKGKTMRQAGASQSMQLKGLVWPTTGPSPYKEQSCAGLEGRKFKGLAGEDNE